MKNLLSLLFLLSGLCLFGQAPNAINYQAIASDDNGPIADASVSVKVDVLQMDIVVYTEKHETTTNSFGHYTLQVGLGSTTFGTYADLDWASGNMSLSIAMDATGGTDYQVLGVSPLYAVPYALYALNGTPQNLTGGGAADPAGVINIGITDGAEIELNVNDNDSDPTNELQDLVFDPANNILSLTSGATPIDLSGLIGGSGNLVNLTVLQLGDPACPDGGTKIDVGIDTNGDGILNPVEVTQTGFLCASASAPTSLISVEPEPAGANCPEGGTEVNTGFDTDGDGILNAAEIQSTHFICASGTPSGPWSQQSGNVYLSNAGQEVGIGTNDPSEALHVVGNICYTGTSGACSDQRYKKEITEIKNALAAIISLRGVTYDWKVDQFPTKDFTAEQQLGVIAQEVEAFFPQIVLTDEKGFKSVDYGKLTAVLIEAVKEQQIQISELQKKQRAVDQRIETLEAILLEGGSAKK